MPEMMLAIGLMSGTSLDGVDAALVLTDGEVVAHLGPSLTRPYPPALREGLRSLLGGNKPVAEIERAMTEFHAATVAALLQKAGIGPEMVGVVGFHGHTILHRPEERYTRQIGDGPLLARLCGIPVVNDFRTEDVEAGGQGAPLVPVFHAALAAKLERPLAVLNLGGVGNVTYIAEDGDLLAFDTGPGNALIDDWALRHTGEPMDRDGILASSGDADEAAVAAFLAHGYFSRKPPKSLDRDDFAALAARMVEGMEPEAGAATLTAFTVASVAAGAKHFPKAAKRWLVCGGGRRNPAIMAGLAAALDAPVEAVDGEGWDGDALEAQAFAFLAVRSIHGFPLSFPGTTGVPAPQCGGTLWGCSD